LAGVVADAAVRYADQRGVLLMHAAGNDHLNYGRQSVDVFAPGVDSISTYSGNEYRSLSSTSMATQVVAGIAAVLKTCFT
jgi:subtilisin family serine protease